MEVFDPSPIFNMIQHVRKARPGMIPRMADLGGSSFRLPILYSDPVAMRHWAALVDKYGGAEDAIWLNSLYVRSMLSDGVPRRCLDASMLENDEAVDPEKLDFEILAILPERLDYLEILRGSDDTLL